MRRKREEGGRRRDEGRETTGLDNVFCLFDDGSREGSPPCS